MPLTRTDALRFALPSKGRLAEPAAELVKASGYKFRLHGRNLYATCRNADIVFIFVRADDIPLLVDRGVVDVGVTGSDLVEERQADVEPLLELGFGRCRLCLAAPEHRSDDRLESFAGQRIATSFPRVTRAFFAERGLEVEPIEMNGSVEIMVALELADAIVDIVETGDSLRENHMQVVADIGRYQTVLIARPDKADDPDVRRIKRRLEGVLVANQWGLLEYNIPEDKLPAAEEVTPGYKSPTVQRLDQPGWLAVKVMVRKDQIVQAMDELETLGATGIFETEIRNCRLGG
jgi:ATP phosphoribosyltransferase